MSVKVDIVTQALPNGTRIGVIVEQAVEDKRLGHGTFVFGIKRPVCVLVRRGDSVGAFDVAGQSIDLNEVEADFPDQCAEFLAS